jgi:hypothetical protein
MHALFLRNLTTNPLILKVFAKTKVGETSAPTLSLKERGSFCLRCLVEIQTGSTTDYAASVLTYLSGECTSRSRSLLIWDSVDSCIHLAGTIASASFSAASPFSFSPIPM